MAIKRYELSDRQWSKVAALLPGKIGDPGRTGSDNRLFITGCPWVLSSGAHWRDLPERYGKWKTVHKRFSRWCHAGIGKRVFETLTADRDNQYLMVDSTIVRAHQQSASEKGGQFINIPGDVSDFIVHIALFASAKRRSIALSTARKIMGLASISIDRKRAATSSTALKKAARRCIFSRAPYIPTA